MSTTKSQKLTIKLTELRKKVAAEKRREAEIKKRAARQTYTHALRTSGLLGLVIAGALSADILEREFRAVASGYSALDKPAEIPVPTVPAADAAMPPLTDDAADSKSIGRP